MHSIESRGEKIIKHFYFLVSKQKKTETKAISTCYPEKPFNESGAILRIIVKYQTRHTPDSGHIFMAKANPYQLKGWDKETTPISMHTTTPRQFSWYERTMKKNFIADTAFVFVCCNIHLGINSCCDVYFPFSASAAFCDICQTTTKLFILGEVNK